jgi:hypothetical protein
VTPTVGAAGCGRFIAIVCQNDFCVGVWLLVAAESMPAGGAREAYLLQRMWATLEDWNARCKGREIRMVYCQQTGGDHAVFQRREARVEVVSPALLLELMSLDAAQQHRAALAGDAVTIGALRHLGDVHDPEALRALDYALSCYGAARATEPLGSC